MCKRWNDTDVQFLKANYSKMDIDDLCENLGRDKSSIWNKAFNLGITGQRYSVNNSWAGRNHNGRNLLAERVKWTEDQLQYLKENYRDKKVKDISAVINHTVFAIHKMAGNLGLRNKYYWSEEDKNYLSENYDRIHMTDIVAHLKRDEKTIYAKAKRLKLVKTKNICLPKEVKVAKPKTIKPKVIKPKIVAIKALKVPSVNPRRKAMETRLATIPFTTIGKKAIKINDKTIVYVKESATEIEIEQVIKKYSKAV